MRVVPVFRAFYVMKFVAVMVGRSQSVHYKMQSSRACEAGDFSLDAIVRIEVFRGDFEGFDCVVDGFAFICYRIVHVVGNAAYFFRPFSVGSVISRMEIEADYSGEAEFCSAKQLNSIAQVSASASHALAVFVCFLERMFISDLIYHVMG